MADSERRVEKVRQANIRLALILASIAFVFFVGFIAKSALFGG